MHARLLPFVLLLLVACGEGPAGVARAPDASRWTDFGANPAQVTPLEAPVFFTPPAGRWREVGDSPAPGQAYEQFLSADRRTLLRLVVFPVRTGLDPQNVLMPTVDAFFRGLGVQGFGLPTRRALSLWGAPAAEATINAVLGGAKVLGEARLLLADPGTWVLTIGYGPADRPAAERQVIERFVRSLEPREARFYSPVFRGPGALEAVVARPPGEAAIRMREIAAIELVLEAGVGARFPLSTRKLVRAALILDVQQGSPKTRSAYREAALALKKSESLEVAERERGLRALGKRILQAILNRSLEGYPPALKFAAVWKRLRGLSLGSREDGLTVGDAANLYELSAFLASLAVDREVTGDDRSGEALRRSLAKGWARLPPAEHRALRTIGATWAALRRAWDLALPAKRFLLRRALAVRLASEGERAALPALPDARSLWQALHAAERKVSDADLLRRATQLPAKERARLATLLGVAPKAHQLGW